MIDMKILFASVAALILCCATAACSASAQEPAASQWPLEIDRGDSRILLYQLQPEALTGDELSARAAVSLSRAKSAEPIFGAVWIDARIATDRDARTVTLLEVNVPSLKLRSEERRVGKEGRSRWPAEAARERR